MALSTLILPPVNGQHPPPLGRRAVLRAERRRTGLDFLTCGQKDVRVVQVHGRGHVSLGGRTVQLSPAPASCALQRGLVESMAMQAAATAIGAPGVAIACCPLPCPYLINVPEDEQDVPPSLRTQKLQKSLSASCIAQLAFAGLDFSLNDPLVGLLGAGVAALGIQASSPSGYRYLPSYIVLSFCNGSMQAMLGVEFFASLAKLGAMKTAGLPLSANPFFVHLLSLASPGLMFIGLYFAYQLYKELRMMRVQGMAYTEPSGARGNVHADDVPLPPGGFRFFEGQAHQLVPDTRQGCQEQAQPRQG
eukprot:TRINITY_DN54527_c0_g2_i1.p1 TRINITY_DN54527_c0_g2~~TRINITY_DN54527_c0_g2_i1.p1  ORF type:complete len:305 (+),score=53.67 TRINITY_DN54527_c0_g2_i1:57-971(+)